MRFTRRRDPVPAVVAAGNLCRNCGALAEAAFCPACGQETALALPSARQFLKEAAGRYVALDGRLWRTLLPLMTRPGFLTREYFTGRRRRYIRPARLFLVLSLLMFALIRISLEVIPVNFEQAVVFDPPKPPPLPADAKARTGAANPKPAPAVPEVMEGEAIGLPRSITLQISDDGALGVTGIEGPFGEALKRRMERFNRLSKSERVEEVTYGMVRYAPYAMFVLLPAFALLLKLVYLGRGKRHPARPRTYAAHLVYAAHTHSFFFLLVTVVSLFSGPVVQSVAALWAAVYTLWSMKAVYGGPWLGVLLRAGVLFTAYLVLFFIVTALLVLPAIMLR